MEGRPSPTLNRLLNYILVGGAFYTYILQAQNTDLSRLLTQGKSKSRNNSMYYYYIKMGTEAR